VRGGGTKIYEVPKKYSILNGLISEQRYINYILSYEQLIGSASKWFLSTNWHRENGPIKLNLYGLWHRQNSPKYRFTILSKLCQCTSFSDFWHGRLFPLNQSYTDSDIEKVVPLNRSYTDSDIDKIHQNTGSRY